MEKFKPCPFCGGEARLIREGTFRQSAIVECTNCGCVLESNSADAWNERYEEKPNE